MTVIFTSILNMSITASYVALGVIAVRIIFKKLPKIFSYALWSAVALRLVCPFSFSSVFSFLNLISSGLPTNAGAMEYVPYNIGLMQNPLVDVGIARINTAVNSSFPPATPEASVNPMQIAMDISSTIWIVGIIVLLSYSTISYLKVIDNLKTATLIEHNIFETDRITSPFVCGLVNPKIYVPVGMDQNEMPHILAHEQTHIRRLDYIIKPFAFFVLIIHWFNPLMWLSFALMSKDMEMSCDESVIKKMGYGSKGGYSNSLLYLSIKKSGLIWGSPLAFGESNVKSRIKNILSYKKPALWVVTAACIATLIFIITFTSNPVKEQNLSINNIERLAEVWANALKTRDGKPRYEMMSQNMKEKFRQEQIIRSGENWNFNIGVSSPWVVDFEVKIDGRLAHITYLTKTSEPASYKTEETLTFGKEDGKLVGADYQIKYEDELIDSTPIAAKIQNYLEIIISSPKSSSNPYDYIKAHQNEYESILKMGKDALDYLLAQFEKGGNNDLKGHIMMALCKDLLGDRNNEKDESLLPQEWFSRLAPYEEIKLPDFKANVSDPIEQLVYDAAVKQYSMPGDGFTVVAPTIFGSYTEETKLKIFATIYSSRYKLYEETLSQTGGSIIPCAITFIRGNDEKYTLQEYREAMDGSYFSKSIEEFCTMPVSGRTIKGLYDKIINDYENNESRDELLSKNLIEHLKYNNKWELTLKTPVK